MPVVPIAQNRVGIASVDGTKLVAPDLSGTGLQALGGGLQNLSKGIDEAHAVAVHNEDIYNEAAVRQADNMLAAKVRDITLTGDGAFYKLSGSDAVGAAQPATAKLSAANDEIKASLKNEAQKRMFGILADRRLQPEFDSIAKHSDTQLAVYNNDQSKARLTLASDNAVTFADDPQRFGDEMTRLGHEVDFQTKGMAPETRQAEYLKAVSGVRTRIVDAKMTADPVGAAAYYQDHREDFTPGDGLAVEKALHSPLVERAAKAAADNAVAAVSGSAPAGAVAPPVVPPAAVGGSTLARMTAITLHSESRGQDYTNGKLTTSSAGAQGAMQTMPGTQRDPGFGVKPAQDDSVAEMNRVGRDYLAAMTKRYGGDPAKAWAAYNGGPGRVDAAVAAHGAGWLGAMPHETQAYVRQNVAMLGGSDGAGAAVGYAPRHDDLSKAYAFIQSQHLPFDVEQAAMAELDHRVARDDHLLVRQQDAAKDQAFTTINQLGKGFTSINQLPADVRRNLSPEVTHSLMDQAEQNAKPKSVPANGDVALVFNRMAVEDKASFLKQDLRLIRDKVTPSEFDSLFTLQGKLNADPKAPEAVSHDKIWGTISRFAPDLGLNLGASNGKWKSSDDHASAMKIFSMMDADLKVTTGNKRQPNDDEIDAAFRRAVTTVKVSKPGAGWFGNPSETTLPRYQLQTPTNDIPGPVRARITASFQRAQRRAPTEGEIMQVYGAHRGQQGFW